MSFTVERLEIRAENVLSQLLRSRGSRYHATNRRIVEDPTDRLLRHRAVSREDLLELIHRLEGDIVVYSAEGLASVEGSTLPVEISVVPLVEGRIPAELAGEKPACEGNPDDNADVTRDGGRKEPFPRPVTEHVVDDLNRGDIIVLYRFERLLNLLHGDTEVSNLALFLEPIEELKNLRPIVDFRWWTVQLDKVERLDTTVPERILHEPSEDLGGVALTLVRRDLPPALGCEEDLLSTSSDDPTHRRLASTVVVDVRCINEADTLIDGGVDNPFSSGVIEVFSPPATNLPGAEGDFRYLESCFSESAIVHTSLCLLIVTAYRGYCRFGKVAWIRPLRLCYTALVMFGFTVKKAFFDLWDNLIPLVLINLLLIFLLLLPLAAAPTLLRENLVLALLVYTLGTVAFFVGLGFAARYTRDIAWYRTPEFSTFVQYLRESSLFSALAGLGFAVATILLFIAFPVYGQMDNLLGLVGFALLFWLTVFLLLAMQYLFPVHTHMNNGVAKSIRKSFLLVLDNPGFTVALAFGSLVVVGLSVFTAFLVPGIGGLLLWHQIGLKLRLYKYDYLEENGDASRKEIPWHALLMDDRDRVGKRTFKGMIFPWKE